LSLANENIPFGDVTSATLRIRASCADLILKGRVLFINGRGNIPRQNVWINWDDVNDHLKGEACYMFAVLSERYLCWEGLLLKRSIVGEDTVYTRVGSLLLFKHDGLPPRRFDVEDFKALLGQEKLEITLI